MGCRPIASSVSTICGQCRGCSLPIASRSLSRPGWKRSAEDSPPRPTARTARVGTPEQALRLVEEYCATRVPEGLEDEIRIECSLRGRAITIVERRPPWNPEFGADWTESKV